MERPSSRCCIEAPTSLRYSTPGADGGSPIPPVCACGPAPKGGKEVCASPVPGSETLTKSARRQRQCHAGFFLGLFPARAWKRRWARRGVFGTSLNSPLSPPAPGLSLHRAGLPHPVCATATTPRRLTLSGLPVSLAHRSRQGGRIRCSWQGRVRNSCNDCTGFFVASVALPKIHSRRRQSRRLPNTASSERTVTHGLGIVLTDC